MTAHQSYGAGPAIFFFALDPYSSPAFVSASLVPANDTTRLQTLERYQLLAARSEKAPNDVMVTAARLFGVYNAMPSIVEK